jgi:hypothetical protein
MRGSRALVTRPNDPDPGRVHAIKAGVVESVDEYNNQTMFTNMIWAAVPRLSIRCGTPALIL